MKMDTITPLIPPTSQLESLASQQKRLIEKLVIDGVSKECATPSVLNIWEFDIGDFLDRSREEYSLLLKMLNTHILTK